MEKYGICDIGSNTIVLIIYEMEDGMPCVKEYQSIPAHLIDEVDQERKMSAKGIAKAYEALNTYRKILDEQNVQYRWADMTEPCRITNLDEVLKALSPLGFEIHPLTGEEEALYDYEGTKFTYPDIKDGIAFDVGGGSTELISFKDGDAVDAMSFHLGCVRLSHLALDNKECEKEILEARQKYPSLDQTCHSLIGIGGTMRAVYIVMDTLTECGSVLSVEKMNEIYQRLLHKDHETWKTIQKKVDAARIPVLLPGIHMILEIARIYEAKEIYFSVTGIREGFLKKQIQDSVS